MCGIAGYVGPSPLERDRLDRCLDAMRRRGPDARGDAAFRTPDGRHVHLLNTRLSILDLDSRSNQPFRIAGKVMTYNGELYNHVEVRARLERMGVAFATRSDTEVVLAAVQRLGHDAFDEFEGMWALAIYDTADGSLLLARDRFGEKPLYLLREGDALYFGSEPKFVFALRGRPLEPDLDHVRRYLVNGYKAVHKGTQTFFRGLEELAPGMALHVAAQGEEASRFWDPRVDVLWNASYDEAVDVVRERLVRSVELRLRADVPLAFCMSGGVDSTALIAVAKRLCGYDVHGFTIENDDARYDEREAVRASVAALDIKHTTVGLTTTAFLDRLRELVAYHDAPVYTISYFVHWRLMEQIAAAGYRVSVSGTGADELFTGYYDHHLAYLHEVRFHRRLHAESLANWERHVQPLVRNPHLRDPDLFVRNRRFRDHIYLDADRFAQALTVPWSEPFAEETYDGGLLRNRMLNELFHESVPAILHEDDLNSMYFSVENRSPYLDRGLFEAAYSTPVRYLIRGGLAKALLREAVRGIAPAHVLDEPRKVGFNAPIGALVDGRDPATRAAILADSPIYELVRKDVVAGLLDRETLPNSESKFLFYVLSAKAFLEHARG